MPRFATSLLFTSSDGETVVDFTGCRGYINDAHQFLDDDIRETKIVASEGTPHFQGQVMGINPHRGNVFSVSLENVEAAKVTALAALNKAMKAIDSHMLATLTDAMLNLEEIAVKGDPDATPFWITWGRESEGMVEDVVIRLVTRV